MGIWWSSEGAAEHCGQRGKGSLCVLLRASRTFPLQNGHRALDITEGFLEESRSCPMEKITVWCVSWLEQACFWSEGSLIVVEVWKGCLDQVTLSWVLDLKEGLGDRR